MRRNLFPSCPPSRGFTLIELLMAIAIAAIALLIVNTTFFQSHRIIESVRDQRETYQMVRIVMDRVIKDLSCAYVPSADRELSEDDISLYRFEAVDESDGEIDKDSIYFTTTADLGLPSISGGICEVGYYLEEMEDKEDVFVLIRRDDCTFHYGLTETGREMELAENVLGMNIVYIDEDSEEKDEWDLADTLSLPTRIRITITFAGGEEPFEVTSVTSPLLASIRLKKALE